MPIEISFDLPYSLQVDGQFVLSALGENFDLISGSGERQERSDRE